MADNEAIYSRLGNNVLDLAVGEWLKCNDIANYSFVRHPDQDLKYYTHELLRILGKRFCAQEAFQIWQEIEKYRATVETLFSPPSGAQGHIPFEQSAREWYALYGPSFEKHWYLNAPLDIHYARSNGRERVKGRWMRLIHPDLVAFAQSGFSPSLVWLGLKIVEPRGLRAILKILFGSNRFLLSQLWIKLAACLMNFSLDSDSLDKASTEITLHAARLSLREGYLLGTAEAALDYFRRLELGGLSIEVVTGDIGEIELRLPDKIESRELRQN